MALTEARKKYLSKWRAKNRDKTAAANKRWYEKNHEAILARGLLTSAKRSESGYYQQWRKNNIEKYREYHREYYHCNPNRKSQVLAATRKRQARKINATPKWLTDFHYKEIEKFYIEAYASGMTVDHIIPLQGEIVCGLHVPWNLQFLSGSENSSKGNKLEHESITALYD